MCLYVALAGRDARVLASERLRTINLPIWLRGSWRFVMPRGLRFAVTPNAGTDGAPLWLVSALITVFSVQSVTVVVASWRVGNGHPEWLAQGLAGGFALWFAVSAGLALLHVVGVSQRLTSRRASPPVCNAHVGSNETTAQEVS